jgi:signal transduction histidine kinase
MTTNPRHAAAGAVDPTWIGASTATFADVDITPELASRPTRAPDYEREHRAFDRLTAEMAGHPADLLQGLVDVTLELCHPQSAGISLLDGEVFRWVAVAGALASARGGTMPRNGSPCGLCVERRATLLLDLADLRLPSPLLTVEPRFVEALLVPFFDGAEPIGTVWMVSHDVERRFDREDERLIGVLSRFASAGWRLMKAEETANGSRQRKTEFLATVAHELRNPFSAILGATALLQQVAVDDPRVSRAAGVIVRQTNHMSRLMEDLLDVERIDRGKLQLERCPVDLRDVAVQAVETRRGQIERQGQVLTVDLGTQPVVVDADPVRLVQVLSNLLDNASKYTPPSGQISIEVATRADDAVMAVRDTGVGVAVDRADRIFEPFAQLDAAGYQPADGLGLGLTLVRRLAELHGGTVELASEGTGRGSTFTVRLPLRSISPWSSRDSRESLVHERNGS